MTRFLLALVLLFLPVSAHARNDGVLCVQEQLASAGQDPGRIDGIVGARTRHALAQHLRARGLEGPRRIHTDSAMPWCRRLGLDDPALRAFWPSALNRVIVDVGDSVDPVLARLIRTRMPGIHADVTQRMGIELAGTDRVVVGSNPVELRARIRSAGFTDIGNLDATLAEHCDPDNAIGGFALPGLMVICLRPGVRLRGGIRYDHLTFVLAHEVTHLVQFQLTGLPPPGTLPASRVPIEGPIWLLEGLADVVGYAVGYDTEADFARRSATTRYAGGRLPDLARLQDRLALRSHQSDIYRAGLIAAALLVEDRGLPSTAQLFARMGEGIPFDQVFEEIYGETPQAFYAAFEARARQDELPADTLSSGGTPGMASGVYYTAPLPGAPRKP
ncbi:hypothetical protein LCM17_17155 [Cereibacter sphaeroides]|nr:hypothetical protein [Cereibacter sphaeroides]